MLCRKYFPVLKKQIVKMVCFFSVVIKIGSLLTIWCFLFIKGVSAIAVFLQTLHMSYEIFFYNKIGSVLSIGGSITEMIESFFLAC